MNHLRGDLGQRLKHEQTLVHQRVGDRKAGGADDFTSVQQQVQVDNARLPLLAPDASKLPLDVEEAVEQFFGTEVGLNLGDCVEKRRRAGRAADRGVFEQ